MDGQGAVGPAYGALDLVRQPVDLGSGDRLAERGLGGSELAGGFSSFRRRDAFDSLPMRSDSRGAGWVVLGQGEGLAEASGGSQPAQVDLPQDEGVDQRVGSVVSMRCGISVIA